MNTYSHEAWPEDNGAVSTQHRVFAQRESGLFVPSFPSTEDTLTIAQMRLTPRRAWYLNTRFRMVLFCRGASLQPPLRPRRKWCYVLILQTLEKHCRHLSGRYYEPWEEARSFPAKLIPIRIFLTNQLAKHFLQHLRKYPDRIFHASVNSKLVLTAPYSIPDNTCRIIVVYCSIVRTRMVSVPPLTPG